MLCTLPLKKVKAIAENYTMMLNLLSDEVAEMMVTDYFNRITKPGDYYSLKNAISKDSILQIF
jgi:hypothetical protein